tara:strand:+ start:868 stop:2163 length:1296 start_codon:yes stop_codon:yes gene_type:complete
MTDKIKIVTLGDHPLAPSGVGTQTKYIIEALLATGKYEFVSLGGAAKHKSTQPIRTEEWGDDWTIIPIEGYGTPDMIRSTLRTERPDMIWFMTDPRFYDWLWSIENEIRAICPMVYYHVWDNYPYPKFNKIWYDSCDAIATISKVTDDIVRTVSPDVRCEYIPHCIDTQIFCPVSEQDSDEEVEVSYDVWKDAFQAESGLNDEERFVIFWNNRNARRKQSGTLVYIFNELLQRLGREKATLIMHTDPHDPHGQDLPHIAQELGLSTTEFRISTAKLHPKMLSYFYNYADVTVNIADAEGFGLGTLESLACGTPIIVNMTGGLQQQVTDGENWFGIGIQPSSKCIVGSQAIPYIYEDRINTDEVVDALETMYRMSVEERNEMGQLARQFVLKNHDLKFYTKWWDEFLSSVIEEHGSWNTRKNYQSWELKEVA